MENAHLINIKKDYLDVKRY